MVETMALIMMFILGVVCGAFLLSIVIICKSWEDERECFTPYEGKGKRR